MAVKNVKLWRIYFTPNCYYVKPEPKDKFVIPVCFDGEKIMGFLINSRISNFVLNMPELIVCEAPIKESDHRHLRHDSFVDCHSLYPFYDWDFQGERGAVSDEAKKQILKAVRDCPEIVRKYKRMILEGHEDLLNDDNDNQSDD